MGVQRVGVVFLLFCCGGTHKLTNIYQLDPVFYGTDKCLPFGSARTDIHLRTDRAAIDDDHDWGNDTGTGYN